jgi:hypothetical protein
MYMFHGKPRALFLFPSRRAFLSEEDICGGLQIADFGGEACAFSRSGRMLFTPHPRTKTLSENGLAVEGYQLPSCVIQEVGSLADWGRETYIAVPDHVAHLPVYKCQQMFLLVLLEATDDFSLGAWPEKN